MIWYSHVSYPKAITMHDSSFVITTRSWRKWDDLRTRQSYYAHVNSVVTLVNLWGSKVLHDVPERRFIVDFYRTEIHKGSFQLDSSMTARYGSERLEATIYPLAQRYPRWTVFARRVCFIIIADAYAWNLCWEKSSRQISCQLCMADAFHSRENTNMLSFALLHSLNVDLASWTTRGNRAYQYNTIWGFKHLAKSVCVIHYFVMREEKLSTYGPIPIVAKRYCLWLNLLKWFYSIEPLFSRSRGCCTVFLLEFSKV